MRRRIDMDMIIGTTLQVGVILSLSLIATGLVWHRLRWGTWQWQLDYTLPATTVFGSSSPTWSRRRASRRGPGCS